MDEAQRGGESGVEFDAAAFVRVQAGSMDGRTEVVQLGDGPRLPLWQATHDLPVSPELSHSLFPPCCCSCAWPSCSMLSPVIFDTRLTKPHFQPVLFRRRKPAALDHRSGAAHPPVALQVVYWCMRCNDISAAVRVMEHGRRLQMRSSWDKLLQLAHIVAGEDVAQYAQAVRGAQEEYWSHGSAMDDYLRVVYSVLAAPDPMLDLHGEDGLLPSRHVTNEDYLWHRLSVTLSTLSVASSLAFSERGGVAAGSLAGSDPLHALQTTLYETYGEDHFNRNRQSPLLFFSVLLHSQQFERALAFLFSVPGFAEDAAHFAIALQHEGLLATAPHSQQVPACSSSNEPIARGSSLGVWSGAGGRRIAGGREGREWHVGRDQAVGGAGGSWRGGSSVQGEKGGRGGKGGRGKRGEIGREGEEGAKGWGGVEEAGGMGRRSEGAREREWEAGRWKGGGDQR
ncbi:MAG: hypothetical protein SGPRY_014999 [Prymnesium sp.]